MTDADRGEIALRFVADAPRVDALTRRITAADGGTFDLWGAREIVWDETLGLRVMMTSAGGFTHHPRPRIIDATGPLPPRRPKPSAWQRLRAWLAGQAPPNEG
jgi:hypothetical protein